MMGAINGASSADADDRVAAATIANTGGIVVDGFILSVGNVSTQLEANYFFWKKEVVALFVFVYKYKQSS